MLHEPAPGIDLSHPYFGGEAPSMMPVETVEAIWQPIASADDWSHLHAALSRIASTKAALDTAPAKAGRNPTGNRTDMPALYKQPRKEKAPA